MNISMLSRLFFPELENLGIEKKNFDCADVVSKYSDMGTDRIEEVLGVESFGRGADLTDDCGWETNGGGCWILADTMSMSLATSAKENLVSASWVSKMSKIEVGAVASRLRARAARGGVESTSWFWRANVVGSAIPGLRAVPDLVPIHPIVPPTVHIHL